ncbi:MAG: hypothetical protein WCE75_11900 [Terracidiphilus sp.]
MASKRKAPCEYRFEIDAYTPETIPLARLSQYLSDLARMMGEGANVHLARVDKGSTVPVIRVDWEAEPKVRERLRAVNFNEGPLEAQRAYREINKKLVEDNANGVLLDPNRGKVIKFPGRDGANQPEFGPIRQHTVLQGIPIRIGGEKNDVPIHLEDGEIKHIVIAPRRLAKQIGPYLFTSVVRIEGNGRWLRNRMGEWELIELYAQSFEVLKEGDVRSDISRLRAIPAGWKEMEDPLGDLIAMRSGERPQ